jgi:hypothetical protein
LVISEENVSPSAEPDTVLTNDRRVTFDDLDKTDSLFLESCRTSLLDAKNGSNSLGVYKYSLGGQPWF